MEQKCTLLPDVLTKFIVVEYSFLRIHKNFAIIHNSQ